MRPWFLRLSLVPERRTPKKPLTLWVNSSTCLNLPKVLLKKNDLQCAFQPTLPPISLTTARTRNVWAFPLLSFRVSIQKETTQTGTPKWSLSMSLSPSPSAVSFVPRSSPWNALVPCSGSPRPSDSPSSPRHSRTPRGFQWPGAVVRGGLWRVKQEFSTW